MNDPDGPSPPRFPYVAAVFCVACVGVAAWLFFRWSYAWDLTPEELDQFGPRRREAGPPSPRPDSRWLDGPTRELLKWLPPDVEVSGVFGHPLLGRYVRARGAEHPGEAGGDAAGDGRAFSGRVVYRSRRWRADLGWPYLAVDTMRSRWTGESVAGLAVGAMGILVFGMTLRHWFAQRRASVGRAGEAKE